LIERVRDPDTVALARRDNIVQWAKQRMAQTDAACKKIEVLLPKVRDKYAIGFDHKISIRGLIPTNSFPGASRRCSRMRRHQKSMSRPAIAPGSELSNTNATNTKR